MKRGLLQTVRVLPYTSGAVIDRAGFLSAVLGATASTAGTLSATVTHSDTENGTYEAVPDPYIVLGEPAETELEAGGTVNVDIDLVGCKQFVKIMAGGTATATLAVALGDKATMPV